MNKDIQLIISALKKPILDLIKSKTSTMVRRESAVVISADNERKTAVVRLGTSPDRSDQNMLLPNCTGENLSAGETVWVDLFGSPSFNAIIVYRNIFDESIK